MFKQDVEDSLARKLANDDRKYMCRVLATVLQTYVQRPSVAHCEVVAKALVRKFPFLKEYVSHLQCTTFFCAYCSAKLLFYSTLGPTSSIQDVKTSIGSPRVNDVMMVVQIQGCQRRAKLLQRSTLTLHSQFMMMMMMWHLSEMLAFYNRNSLSPSHNLQV